MPVPRTGGSEKGLFIWAVGQQESGGNYHAVNPGSGALGRWQVMPANLPGWEAHCRMPQAGPDYFLTHPLYQNRMIDCILGGYYNRYGPYGAASMWYSGQPDWQATYGNPPVYVYVRDVIALMKDPNARPIPGISGGAPPFGETPVPTRQDDWSAHIKRSAEQFSNVSQGLSAHTQRIRALL